MHKTDEIVRYFMWKKFDGLSVVMTVIPSYVPYVLRTDTIKFLIYVLHRVSLAHMGQSNIISVSVQG